VQLRRSGAHRFWPRARDQTAVSRGSRVFQGGGAEGLRQQGDTRKEFVLAAFYSFTVAPLQPETAKIEKGVNVNPARRTTDHGVV